MKPQKQIEDIKRIAKYILHIRKLEPQMDDSKDFHELSIWAIVDALNSAYQAGYAASFEKRFNEKD